jgi:hypothetical protein
MQFIEIDASGLSFGQHLCQGAPGWNRHSEKTASKASANHVEAGTQRFIWLPRLLSCFLH